MAELAEADLRDAVIGATADPSISWLGVSVDRPVLREFGLTARTPYFNAGVLVVDVERWRAAGIGDAVCDFLRANWQQIHRGDQDALNVVLADRRHTLDLTWNQTASIQSDRGLDHIVLPADEIDRLRAEPKLVHFTGRRGKKPLDRPNDPPLRATLVRGPRHNRLGRMAAVASR